MKKDSNGNEVYFGYTLVKPKNHGNVYRIKDSKGKEIFTGPLWTRQHARAAVKKVLNETASVKPFGHQSAESVKKYGLVPFTLDGLQAAEELGVVLDETVSPEPFTMAEKPKNVPEAWTFTEKLSPTWRMRQEYADILASNVQSADEIVNETSETGYIFYPVSIRRILPDYPTQYKHHLHFENGTAVVEYYNVEKHIGVSADDVIERALASVPAVPDAPKRSWKPKPDPATVYFRLDGGIGEGKRIGKVAETGGGVVLVEVTKSRRSPSKIGTKIKVAKSELLTEKEVDIIKERTKEERALRKHNPLRSVLPVAYRRRR